MNTSDHISIDAPHQNAATILCCNCGAPIDGTASAGALCYECIKLTVDVTEGIQREATLHQCRDCDRWLAPPQQWVVAQPESVELLALCLKKLRGLNKVRITDAKFIWTEAHSKRVRTKVTVQQEAFANTIVQQSFEVEYVIASYQCPDCAKSYTHNTWRSVVQVRQKVTHKRTFLYLEQLILKHGAHKDAINIKEIHDGIDFFFSARNHAEKFMDFLGSVAPIQTKKSSELISEDTHSGTKSYKFSFAVEIVPICKDDLVALPLKLAQKSSNMTPIAICHKVGTTVNLLDPATLHTAEISTKEYWHSPFTALADVKELVEYVVLDIEPTGVEHGRWVLAEATVARAADLGSNDQTFFTRTHLGGILHPGDSVMGYSFNGTNYNNDNLDAIMQHPKYSAIVPDVILVKKHYPRQHKSRNNRNWRLKRMAREESDMAPRKQDQERMEQDYEMFLRDVEEDQEFRSAIAVYKAPQAAPEETMDDIMEEDEEEVNEALEIPLDELLDDLENLTINN